MANSVRIASVVMFLIGATLIIPKIADAAGTLNGNVNSAAASEKLTETKVKSEALTDIYVPPNYGGPDSEYGSGTR